MTRFAYATTILAAMLAFILPGTPARALNAVSYVSGAGGDSNNTCFNPTTPCQTLNQALANTFNGGQIICVGGGSLSSSFTITQSVTIDCAGTTGFTFGQFTINAPGSIVKIRNLTINGVGSVASGITVNNVAALFVENCHITGYGSTSPGIGIIFAPTAPASQLIVRDSVIDGNGGGGIGGGIKVAPASGGSAGVLIDRVKFGYNVTAMALISGSGAISATITDSVVMASLSNGILALGGGQPLNLTITNSKLVGNVGTAIQSNGASSFVVLDNTVVTGNQIGLNPVNGGQMQSFRNNRIFGNSNDGTPIAAVSAGLQ